jgi:hypothetical protein
VYQPLDGCACRCKLLLQPGHDHGRLSAGTLRSQVRRTESAWPVRATQTDLAIAHSMRPRVTLAPGCGTQIFHHRSHLVHLNGALLQLALGVTQRLR